MDRLGGVELAKQVLVADEDLFAVDLPCTPPPVTESKSCTDTISAPRSLAASTMARARWMFAVGFHGCGSGLGRISHQFMVFGRISNSVDFGWPSVSVSGLSTINVSTLSIVSRTSAF